MKLMETKHNTSSTQITTYCETIEHEPNTSKTLVEKFMEFTDSKAKKNTVEMPECWDEKLSNFTQTQKRLDSGTDILKYWYNKRFSDPQLYSISNVVLSSPATQVSVERSFSALPIILRKQRFCLSADNIQNILIVRLNEDLLDGVIFTD